ncbi:M1 family metallopeptidase [Cellulomonas composti]|uniref:Aminopeptidase N n=1 Tax=Cellulomonas composti TaxID=266130 RepID=A0A511J8U0_9CELL|nr:M1 family metallopeptidase [Cellulomonas composti]GEL94412.1 putative peptidase M1, membrane alanine aminopeptidase [Cellulomonas composti]
MTAELPSDPYLAGRVDGGLSVSRYELELDYRVATNRLEGRARIHATTRRGLDRFSLDLDRLRVSEVLVDGRRPARWSHRAGRLSVRPARPLPVGTSLVVEVAYSGSPAPSRGPWGEVGWEELADGVIVAGQPDGAPSWFPCVDTPADKASFRIVVTADAGYEVVCNGTLFSRTVRASRVRWVYDQPEPTAPYLATVQIGRYRRTLLSLAPVRQQVVAPARLAARVAHDLERQPRMLELFAGLFGPYPFPEYTVVVTDDALEIPLEAHGISVFGENHVDGERGSERLVAHELAHQWFGNSLTATTWRDIWLHEGFACYAEWLWAQESGERSADECARDAWRRLAALPQDLVVAEPGPDLMFDDRLYKRGALTLHALRLTVGDDAFFDLLRIWTARHRHGGVSTAQFEELASVVARVPLGPLLDDWLAHPALPALPAPR